MKPLLVSTFDIQGGAARAAYRLHTGLRQVGVDSRMLVQEKVSDDYTVRGPESKSEYLFARIRANFDRVPLSFYPKHQSSFFSSAILPDTLKSEVSSINPDIVHLHWVSYGFMRIETLTNIRRPIVWTLHDMWPFTGGCHYSEGCERYTNSCGGCPQLFSEKQHDLSRWNLNRKAKNWSTLPMTIVSPSRWLGECASKSPLFSSMDVRIIPYGIDLNVFSPRDKRLCRQILGLPQDKKIILTGAIDINSDKRKGLDLLLSSLHQICEVDLAMELVIIGASKPHKTPDFGIPVHYLGKLNDEISLSLAYSAADIFVAPSREENLSNMVLEAIASGLPCVAFNIGGMPDMIEHDINGFLVSPFITSDLSFYILKILSDNHLRENMSNCSRLKAVRKFSLKDTTYCYKQLYEELIS